MWILTEYLATFSRDKYLKKDYYNPVIQQESTFWRRSLWEKAGSTMRTDLKFAGDLELWMRFFRFSQLYTVDSLLGGYRQHGNQKATVFTDKYIEEAETILDEEIKLFQQGKYQCLLPAPQPVTLLHSEIKSYIDKTYSSHQNQIYKISDDSDLVVNLLLKKVTSPASAILIISVHLLRKLHLYNFYRRHPKYFSLTYNLFRRIFRIKDAQK